RGGPAGGPPGGPPAARRLDRDGAEGGGRERGGGARRQIHALFRALRLPRVWLVAPRARAAPVFLQFAVRCVPRLLGTRDPARGEPRLGPRRPEPFDSRRGHPAVGRAER